MLVFSPSVRLNTVILKVLEVGGGKLATLCNDLSIAIILHAHRALALSKGEQLVNKDVLEVVVLSLIFLVNLGQDNLILLLRLTCLNSTREQFLVDNHTAQ